MLEQDADVESTSPVWISFADLMTGLLGAFVLLLVGVMLSAEGGHIAHLSFFGYDIEPMAKSTFYFVVGALVVVDILQGRYQKKLARDVVNDG